jgi:hypothetical protein
MTLLNDVFDQAVTLEPTGTAGEALWGLSPHPDAREHRAELFPRLDGKDYRPGLWQRVRPAGGRSEGEDGT